jgi:hypothetical protein
MRGNLAAPPAWRKLFDHVEPVASARQQTARAMIRKARIVGSALYIAYREAQVSRFNRAVLATGRATHPEDAACLRDPAPAGLAAPQFDRQL